MRSSGRIRNSRFTAAQIIGMIKEQEAAADCRDAPEAWVECGAGLQAEGQIRGLEVFDTRRLQLEDENSKRKRLLADIMLDNVVLSALLLLWLPPLRQEVLNR